MKTFILSILLLNICLSQRTFSRPFADDNFIVRMDTVADNAWYEVDEILIRKDTLYAVLSYGRIPFFKRVNVIIKPEKSWIAVQGGYLKSIVLYDERCRKRIEDTCESASPKTIYTGHLYKGTYFIFIKTALTSFIQKITL